MISSKVLVAAILVVFVVSVQSFRIEPYHSGCDCRCDRYYDGCGSSCCNSGCDSCCDRKDTINIHLSPVIEKFNRLKSCCGGGGCGCDSCGYGDCGHGGCGYGGCGYEGCGYGGYGYGGCGECGGGCGGGCCGGCEGGCGGGYGHGHGCGCGKKGKWLRSPFLWKKIHKINRYYGCM
ncbi:keratin-associated protein 5-1 isoform X1 [Diabrotica virgifera virgifera]|uniref:Uncharacterized protein n=1 Tax=Diabrotica virgifera virgifera TaxID=50390 RepID=A0ABM5IG06_DIAVI|nr:keratin-associated protein 5-1 isoform X1 [Diabrotica virgifera virgifera]